MLSLKIFQLLLIICIFNIKSSYYSLGQTKPVLEDDDRLPYRIQQHYGGIHCMIGYGQEGAAFDEAQTWPRYCRDSNYCWKAHTDGRDINILREMFVFPWKDHYEFYYVQGCGGYLGTPLEDPQLPPTDWDWQTGPWMQNVHSAYKGLYLDVKVNVTESPDVRLQGGQLLLKIDYTCNEDLCSEAYKNKNIIISFIITFIVIIINGLT